MADLPPPSSQALAIIPSSAFPILAGDMTLAIGELRAALGSRQLTVDSLEKIRMPSGDVLEFRVPTADGVAIRTALTGSILGVTTPRVLWGDKYGKGEKGAPPICQSADGEFGDGQYGPTGEFGGRAPNVPRGSCKTCPMNAFPPHGAEDRGKPCAELRNVFMMPLGEDVLLPQVVIVTPGSLKKQPNKDDPDGYLVALANRRVRPSDVVTEITLKPATSGGGYNYSRASFKRIGTLSEEDRDKMRAYAGAMTGEFAQLQPTREDTRGGGRADDEAAMAAYTAQVRGDGGAIEGEFAEV